MDSCAGSGSSMPRIVIETRLISAREQSAPEPGGPFSLFQGGVKGTYESVERPKKFVQKWALSSPSWPSGKTLV